VHRHPLDLLDQLVERGVLRLNPRLQKRQGLRLLLRISRRDLVVFREVQIDDRIAAGIIFLVVRPRRRRLDQLGGKIVSLGQQE